MILFRTAFSKRSFLTKLKAHVVANALAEEDTKSPTRGLPEQLFYLCMKLSCLVDFYEAVSVNADITHVLDKWFLWLLDVELGKYKTSKPVSDLYRRRLNGDEPTKKEWRAAAADADAAYAYAYAAARADSYKRMREALLQITAETTTTQEPQHHATAL